MFPPKVLAVISMGSYSFIINTSVVNKQKLNTFALDWSNVNRQTHWKFITTSTRGMNYIDSENTAWMAPTSETNSHF